MKIVQIFFLLLFSCFFAHDSHAQSWSVGVQAGENFSLLTGEADSDFNPGFAIGVNASHYLSKKMVLRLELNWERKGASFDPPTVPDPDFVEEYNLDYLSLPVLLRYTAMGNKIRYVAGGGVSLDYLTKERTFFEASSVNNIGDFRRFDTELVLCAGTAVPIGKNMMLAFEVRSLIGLLKVNKLNGTATDLGRNFSWGLICSWNYYL